jgi:ubiquinone/menaquinone biosynthesis C-methylase UbiE
VTDAMQAEFDTVAEWTAAVAVELGPEYHVPAGCRGSGSPAALDWLLDEMHAVVGDVFLDCGAGVGGPAAYAARSRSVRPVLVEPEAGGCRAATRLFGYPTLRADASALPFADASFNAAWSLGVLCTTPDQISLLDELRRVVRPSGRIGLLTFVAHRDLSNDHVEGNHFPTSSGLEDLVTKSSLSVEQSLSAAELPAIPATWNDRIETVERALANRHRHTEAWQLAERQSSAIAKLLDSGAVTAELLVLRHSR